MVENNNGYNRGRKRYNGNHHGGYRKGHNIRGNVGSKGLLNFLFSFNGRISKNLYIGFLFFYTFLSSLMVLSESLVMSLESKGVGAGFGFGSFLILVFSVLIVLNGLLCLALGFKRAHALGVSGIYSFIGFVCLPFFCFYGRDRDFANDNVYKPRFKFFKNIGALVNKNVFSQIVFLFLFFILDILPLLLDRMSLGLIALSLYFFFNLLQLLLIRYSRWFARHYVGFTKVVTFVAYNIFIIFISVVVTVAALGVLSKM